MNVVREYQRPGAKVPSYVLAVTSRDLHKRKERWEHERRYGRVRPELQPWRPTDEDDPEAGILVSVGFDGRIEKTATCDGVQGVWPFADGLLAARHGVITLYSWHLEERGTFASHACFNDLHSLRNAAEAGILVASTGTDSVVELTPGGDVRWFWCALDQGLTTDSFGDSRTLDQQTDHRGIIYDTWLRTTHVNAAAPLGEDSILVTLFHQGVLGMIDRRTGTLVPVLTGLERPHAVRWSNDLLTLADTARGRALAGYLDDTSFTISMSVSIDTGWLQDCQLLGEYWLLVDGENSRVLFMDVEGQLLAKDQFDPNWLLYEAALIPHNHENVAGG